MSSWLWPHFRMRSRTHKHHEQISVLRYSQMDDQLIELCGRHRLTESLLGAGLRWPSQHVIAGLT